MRNLFYIFIIVVNQLILITYLGIKITNKLNLISINAIDKSGIIQQGITEANHYFEPKPNLVDFRSSECGQRQTYTNNEGFVGHKNFEISKKSTITRIITLGDSFTHGICVDTNKSWPSLLENGLNNKEERFEVINLGYDSYDIYYSALRFKYKGAKYKPDAVIWLILENDFSENNEVLQSKYEGYKKSLTFDAEAYNRAFKEARVNYKNNKSFFLQVNKEYLLTISKDVSPVPIYIFTYAITDSDILDIFHKLSLKQPNIEYIMNISQLSQDETLVDGHPNEKGHLKIEEMIMKSLFEKLKHIQP